MTLLLVDVGNSYTKWLFRETDLLNQKGQFPTREVVENFESLILSLQTKCPIYVSWVASDGARNAFELMLSKFDNLLVFAKSEPQQCGLINGYENPTILGVDRWLAMLGIWSKVKKGFCIVDAGTAMTIDFVDSSGKHLGGYIAPGLETMILSLNSRTSLINFENRNVSMSTVSPGNNTADAVYRGVLLAMTGAIEKAIQTIFTQGLGDFVCLRIGGGAAPALKPLLGNEWVVSDSLVLDGLVEYAIESMGYPASVVTLPKNE